MQEQTTADTATKIVLLDTDHAQAEALIEIAQAWQARSNDPIPTAVCLKLADAHCRRAGREIANLPSESASDLMPSEARRENMLRLLQQQHSLESLVASMNLALPEPVRKKAENAQAVSPKQRALLAAVKRANEQLANGNHPDEISAAYVRAAAAFLKESHSLMVQLPMERQTQLLHQHAAIAELVESLTDKWQSNLPIVKSPTIIEIDDDYEFEKFVGAVTPGQTTAGVAWASKEKNIMVAFISFYHDGAIHHQALRDPFPRSLPIADLYRDISKFRDKFQYRTDVADRLLTLQANAALRAMDLEIYDLTPKSLMTFVTNAVKQRLLPRGSGALIMDTLCAHELGMHQRLTYTNADDGDAMARADQPTIDAVMHAAEDGNMAPAHLALLQSFLEGSPVASIFRPPTCDDDELHRLQAIAENAGMTPATAAAILRIAVHAP